MGPKSLDIRSSELCKVKSVILILFRHHNGGGHVLAIHVFHTHDNVPGVVLKGSVEGDNVR